MTGLGQLISGWPLVVSMVTAVAVQTLRAGRRRTALNRALHELRRPLQAVALASGPSLGGGGEDALELAASALERLDREINGGSAPPAWGTVDGIGVVRAAVARWEAKVRFAEGSLVLRWNAGDALVRGDRLALGQALDNLIVNAIEHGGPTIVVAARRRQRRLRIAVVDSGRAARHPARRRAPARAIARLAGGERRGHGLAVVRHVAAEHGGRFALRRSERGSLAVLELPLAGPDGELAA